MPCSKATIKTTKAPNAPASVGVAHPVDTEPIITATTKNIGKVPGNVSKRSFQVNPVMTGPN